MLYLSERYTPEFVKRRLMKMHDQSRGEVHGHLLKIFGNAVKCYGCDVVFSARIGGDRGACTQEEDQDQAWGYVYASRHGV